MLVVVNLWGTWMVKIDEMKLWFSLFQKECVKVFRVATVVLSKLGLCTIVPYLYQWSVFGFWWKIVCEWRQIVNRCPVFLSKTLIWLDEHFMVFESVEFEICQHSELLVDKCVCVLWWMAKLLIFAKMMQLSNVKEKMSFLLFGRSQNRIQHKDKRRH